MHRSNASKAGYIVVGIILFTGLLWYFIQKDEIIYLGGVLLCGYMVGDVIAGYRKNRPSKLRKKIQAFVVCIVGGVLCLVLLWLVLSSLVF